RVACRASPHVVAAGGMASSAAREPVEDPASKVLITSSVADQKLYSIRSYAARLMGQAHCTDVAPVQQPGLTGGHPRLSAVGIGYRPVVSPGRRNVCRETHDGRARRLSGGSCVLGVKSGG